MSSFVPLSTGALDRARTEHTQAESIAKAAFDAWQSDRTTLKKALYDVAKAEEEVARCLVLLELIRTPEGLTERLMEAQAKIDDFRTRLDSDPSDTEMKYYLDEAKQQLRKVNSRDEAEKKEREAEERRDKAAEMLSKAEADLTIIKTQGGEKKDMNVEAAIRLEKAEAVVAKEKAVIG